MTQAFNLSQVANKIDSSGKLDGSTGLNGTLPIANGGTNNASLATTAGGIVYTDGSKLVNTGAGTSGQFLRSNGASVPSWQTLTVSSYTFLGTLTPTNGSNSATISGLNLTNYKWIIVEVSGQPRPNNNAYWSIGTSNFFGVGTNTAFVVGAITTLDLIYGKASNISWNRATQVDNVLKNHGYTTASTSITMTTTQTFNNTPIYFWGQT